MKFNPNSARAEKTALRAAAENLIATAKEAKRDLTSDESSQFDGFISAIKQLDARLERHAANLPQLDAVAMPNIQGALRGQRERSEHPEFTAYLRTGVISAAADLSPAADGAVLIPEVLYQTVTHREAGFRPVEQVGRIVSTDNGDPMKFPRIDDTVSGEYLDASASIGSAAPPSSLDSITLGAFKASSKPIAVARELLVDSQYDVAREIVTVQLNRTGRLLNDSFTNGDGTNEPEGFLSGCATVRAAGGTLTLDDVLSLLYGIPQQFRKNTNVFQMHSNTQKFLRALKTGISGDQRPLWQESPRAGEPSLLYGVPVILNDAMPVVGTAGAMVADCVCYGDFASSFLIRRAGPAYILRYPLPQTDETGFIVFERADSKLLIPEAIVALGEAGSGS